VLQPFLGFRVFDTAIIDATTQTAFTGLDVGEVPPAMDDLVAGETKAAIRAQDLTHAVVLIGREVAARCGADRRVGRADELVHVLEPGDHPGQRLAVLGELPLELDG
jgi:hypothetical protein